MTEPAWRAAMTALIASEGGYSDHPADRGGHTKFGVTSATLRRARSHLRDLPPEVRQLTIDDATRIYRRLYWSEVNAGELPSAVAIVVFDHAVNAGPTRAAKMLQKELGVRADGIVGRRTIAAAAAADRDLVLRLTASRLDYYDGIVARRPSQGVFLRGWRIRAARALAAAAPFLTESR